ncbi:mitogen-activated protein kinase kinase kinase 4 isoform X3 [Bradysia coprophila]|uniref:mitogen-activated protein kinase kinase kinase 4 isoform X3 n=1 Tax=Bradysia coprophila TaxID=38358 RepID=UPI00187DC32F|nr:mitogen-activated protein kinase kinase kinase 4 isoform X3 [Bradysia coprophila]
MADADWKKRVGININYSSSGEEDDDLSKVEFRKKNTSPDSITSLDVENGYEKLTSTEELLTKFEQYGSTPPRTRIKIKNRDWERKKGEITTKQTRGTTRMARSRANRRNTMDCAILNEMFIDDDNSKANDKRSRNLLRDSEREAKRSSVLNPPGPIDLTNPITYEERAESMPMPRPLTKNMLAIVPKLVESCNRYMSVTSRPVGCRTSAPPISFGCTTDEAFDRKFQTRRDFHETFANLIKLGSTTSDKQETKMSPEDHTWQTELKDLIWLELQAWHADRSLDQQDKYLYTARQGVPELLEKIQNYKFHPKYIREASVISTDSGNGSDGSSQSQTPDATDNKSTICQDCYSLYCKYCQQQQVIALREVEELLTRLEAAESLYPSSQSMASHHPIYRCESFVGRVKAMCLWYNITKHQQLKLLMVGKLFRKLQGKDFQWPTSVHIHPSDSSTSSSAPDNDDSGRDSIDSRQLKIPTIPKVKFNIEGDGPGSDSPSDSASSNESSKDITSPTEMQQEEYDSNSTFTRYMNDINFFESSKTKGYTLSTSPYRKYIEHILKSRGLGKSLAFLHRLYNVVLRKTMITLEKPGTEDVEFDIEAFSEDLPLAETPIDAEQVEELRRYGSWSPESQTLNLPSYAPTFVFLTVIPLEILHEYLRMRIESKPLTPNPLSLEQLMKELREGLILAMTHRERYSKHIHTALYDKDSVLEKYLVILDEFDATIRNVFMLYLDYVEHWVLEASPEAHRKAALHKEWMFSKLICPMISGQHSVTAHKFCSIVSKLLEQIGKRLITRAQELDEKIEDTPISSADDEKKWQILTICRETQSLFTVEREKALKILYFAKTLCRDLEMSDFHREHEDYVHGTTTICSEVKESVRMLQAQVLSVRHKLTQIVEHVQMRCDNKHLTDMDEQDRIAVLSRIREVLHQGFKFGFDYHKEIIRLFETKVVGCRDKTCEFNLSMGIVHFARMWMLFVTQRCERGRGVRPRWAAQGLDFLIAACDPSNTKHLNEQEFDDLKSKMDACISHVVGIVPKPEIRKRASPRSRKVSPQTGRALTPTRTSLSPRHLPTDDQKMYQHQFSVKEDPVGMSPTSAPNTPTLIRKQTSCEVETSGVTLKVPKLYSYSPVLRQIRVRDAVNRVDLELDRHLRDLNLIGQVKTLNNSDKIHIRARSVNFRWHRGIKIGQGRFGKVYTAVNNSTGELMAMKEITIQPNETRAIKNVAEELKIFEGISHKYLVKYYGVEIHREELLIFMELCSEGTLENLVELSGGLHEGLTRRFTVQLLSAVHELHKHGVVHRDIKTANIFLTNEGNCLKLGDFGSAVKIQAHTTVAGELQGYVGTQAYMAPEVFTKTNSVGHGRSADIWSVGCVVIEMASGKRPWSQFDSNFQIMFKVGMGETPDAPPSLSQEGHDFLDHCLQHDPKIRWNALELLQHNFCKVIQCGSYC